MAQTDEQQMNVNESDIRCITERVCSDVEKNSENYSAFHNSTFHM